MSPPADYRPRELNAHEVMQALRAIADDIERGRVVGPAELTVTLEGISQAYAALVARKALEAGAP